MVCACKEFNWYSVQHYVNMDTNLKKKHKLATSGARQKVYKAMYIYKEVMAIYILYPKWLVIEKTALLKETAFKILRLFVYSSKQNHHINNTPLFPISLPLPNTTAFKITAQKVISLSSSALFSLSFTHTHTHTPPTTVIQLVQKKTSTWLKNKREKQLYAV